MLEAGSETYITLEGSPALHVAIAAGSLPHFADATAECVALLVEKEADVFATDDYGKSALHLAAGHGLTKCVAHLLELYPTDGGEVGEDGEPMLDPINARDKYGWTPLHHACYAGHADCTEALIGKGADVAKCTKAGATALHAAVVGRDLATVQAVLAGSKGGDELVGAVCSLGRTALNTAEAKGYPQIAALLRGDVQNAPILAGRR